jgi:peptidyl-prolyl cis-trans isomerase A (cyclophilin A)
LKSVISPRMAASVMAATSAFLPTASAISSMHSMLISVESMSKATALKDDSFKGGVKREMTRPGANCWGDMLGWAAACHVGTGRLDYPSTRGPHGALPNFAAEVGSRQGLWCGAVALGLTRMVPKPEWTRHCPCAGSRPDKPQATSTKHPMISANRETSSPLSLWAKRWTLALAATGVGLMVSGCKTEYNTASTFNNTVASVKDAAKVVKINSVTPLSGFPLKFGFAAFIVITGQHLDKVNLPTSEMCANMVAVEFTTERAVVRCAPQTLSFQLEISDEDGVQLGVYPFEVPKPQVKVVTTEGDIVLELDADVVPYTVGNYLSYVNNKYYDGTIFHRVVSDAGNPDPDNFRSPMYIIQGGGFTGVSGAALVPQTGDLDAPIELESNKELSNVAGTIAMARSRDPAYDSATSQFFINVKDNIYFDYQSSTDPGYAVFGRVISGLDVAERINLVPTQTVGSSENVPVTDVKIVSATQIR